MIKIKLLGTSAGGGLPQWNCNCINCKNARIGTIPSRTQSSIAVTRDNKSWVLINTSPDIRYQINMNPDIYLKDECSIRENRFQSIILLDGQLDHTLGLLNIREGFSLNIFCTRIVKRQITEEFPVIKILDNYCGTNYNEINPDELFSINGIDSIDFIPVNISSNSPPYSKYRNIYKYGSNIGLIIHNKITDKKIFYCPGLGKVTNKIKKIFNSVDQLLIDGTLWSNNELIEQNISKSTSKDMGHVAQSGDNGMINILKDYPNLKKTLIHINNTNPILNNCSTEYNFLVENDIQISNDNEDLFI